MLHLIDGAMSALSNPCLNSGQFTNCPYEPLSFFSKNPQKEGDGAE